MTNSRNAQPNRKFKTSELGNLKMKRTKTAEQWHLHVKSESGIDHWCSRGWHLSKKRTFWQIQFQQVEFKSLNRKNVIIESFKRKVQPLATYTRAAWQLKKSPDNCFLENQFCRPHRNVFDTFCVNEKWAKKLKISRYCNIFVFLGTLLFFAFSCSCLLLSNILF